MPTLGKEGRYTVGADPKRGWQATPRNYFFIFEYVGEFEAMF
jgi:hypothetical protein